MDTEITNKLDSSCEPMDVDRSLGSSPVVTSTSSIDGPSCKPICTPAEQEGCTKNQSFGLLTRRRNRVKRLKVDVSMKRNGFTTRRVILLSFATAVCAFALYFWARPSCCDVSSFEHMEDHFTKLYGQDKAVANILQSFKDVSSTKLVFFYGTTGVGKTYATRIIMERMHGHNNVFHFSASTVVNLSMKTVLAALQHCSFTLIVVDDVSVNDTNVKTVVKEIVNKASSLQNDVYIILVCSNELVTAGFHKITDKTLIHKLEVVYRDVPSSKYFVEFDQLTVYELQLCIEDAVSLYKYKVPSTFSQSMTSQFDVKADGCKSVTNKIKGMNLPKSN